jgi:hypothetical protein
MGGYFLGQTFERSSIMGPTPHFLSMNFVQKKGENTKIIEKMK